MPAAKTLRLHRSVREREVALHQGRYFSLKSLERKEEEGVAVAAGGAVGAASVAPLTRWRLKANAADVAALLKLDPDVLASPALLVQQARGRGLLWGEPRAIKFVADIAKKEAVFLEQVCRAISLVCVRKLQLQGRGVMCGVDNSLPLLLLLLLLRLVKHKFPALHKRLCISMAPTVPQAAASAAALPSLPAGPPLALSVGIGVVGGGAMAWSAAAPRPSAAAAAAAATAAAAAPLEEDDVVFVGGGVGGKPKRGKAGAGPRVPMPPKPVLLMTFHIKSSCSRLTNNRPSAFVICI